MRGREKEIYLLTPTRPPSMHPDEAVSDCGRDTSNQDEAALYPGRDHEAASFAGRDSGH